MACAMLALGGCARKRVEPTDDQMHTMTKMLEAAERERDDAGAALPPPSADR